jgi:hypothetical protein
VTLIYLNYFFDKDLIQTIVEINCYAQQLKNSRCNSFSERSWVSDCQSMTFPLVNHLPYGRATCPSNSTFHWNHQGQDKDIQATWVKFCLPVVFHTVLKDTQNKSNSSETLWTPAPQRLYIVTCGPFLANKLANTLPLRDGFLETNWLWNTVSEKTHSWRAVREPLEAVISIRFCCSYKREFIREF